MFSALFTFAISMVAQTLTFILNINLGGVTLGAIYATLFLVSALFGLMSFMIGNASISRFKAPPESRKGK